MGIDQRGSGLTSDAGWEQGYRTADEILRDRDLERGIHREEGNMICIEYPVYGQTHNLPLDPSEDEIRGSIEIACKQADLSIKGIKVMKNERRQSFSVLLPTETCDFLVRERVIDIYYAPDRHQDDVEYQIYATDDRGNKIRDNNNQAHDANRADRDAQRELDRQRRKELMLTIHYSCPRDLLFAKDDSPIFGRIKTDIIARIERVFGADPDKPPQHVNLLDAKTEEGMNAYGFTAFIVLHNDFHTKPELLHNTYDLSPLKYLSSGTGSLVTSRMPKRILDKWEIKQCCYRHNPMELGDVQPKYECPTDEGTCQLRTQTLALIMAKMRADPNRTPMEQQGESLSEQRKRQKIESQMQKQQAAAAHRATIQPKTCRRWEQGLCRNVGFIGCSKCTKSHPDEASQTQQIECCSSAARPEPKQCFFANGKCPYNGHRETI